MGKSSGNHSSTWIIIRVRSRREVMKFIQMTSSLYPIPFYHRLFPAFKNVLSFTYLEHMPQMKLASNGSFYGITGLGGAALVHRGTGQHVHLSSARRCFLPAKHWFHGENPWNSWDFVEKRDGKIWKNRVNLWSSATQNGEIKRKQRTSVWSSACSFPGTAAKTQFAPPSHPRSYESQSSGARPCWRGWVCLK